MSANTNAAAPAKSKKMLVIIVGLVVVLLLGAVAAWFMASRGHDEEEGAGPASSSAPKVAPTFLPMENMVVNLADPGGDRFAQVGVTLELDDAKTADQVKQYLPSIRSGILLQLSQRTSTELLQREGKEKLAADILREVSRPLGINVPTAKERARAESQEAEDDELEERPASRRAQRNPVRRVLFSSFIIQ